MSQRLRGFELLCRQQFDAVSEVATLQQSERSLQRQLAEEREKLRELESSHRGNVRGPRSGLQSATASSSEIELNFIAQRSSLWPKLIESAIFTEHVMQSLI